MDAPDPKGAPPAVFSARANAEIEQHAFAAKTGGLVTLSAPTFWELYEAAKAWQELPAKAKAKHRACGMCLGTGKNIMHGTPCESCKGTGRKQQPATAL